MLKEHSQVITYANKIVDLVITVLSFFFAYAVSKFLAPYFSSLNLDFFQDLQPVSQYVWILLVVVPSWAVFLSLAGLYSSLRTVSFNTVVVRLSYSIFLGGLFSASSVFMFKQYLFSRGLFVTFLLINYMSLLLWKYFVRLLQKKIRTRGYNFRQILIIGRDNRMEGIRNLLESNREWGLTVKGCLCFNRERKNLEGRLSDNEVVIALTDFRKLISGHVVDEVILCLDKDDMLYAEEIVQYCEEMGITARFLLDIFDLTISRTAITKLQDYYLLTLHTISLDRDQALIKRGLDIIISLIGLLVTTGILLPVVLAIKATSKGPVFFKQKRVGQNGRLFSMYKFRTMFVDAEKRKAELMHRNEMDGAMFKIKEDPRITRAGKFLRRVSLDEFPQFFNVFRGDMSVVGTRPPLPEEVDSYTSWQRRRLSIKPGLTGLWQVSGRGEITDFDEIVKQDLSYIDRWTLWLDIRIILKTIWVVLTRRGE